MKISELLELISNSTRIRIFREGEKDPLYCNYKGMIVHTGEETDFLTADPKVVRFQATPEIRHRLYEERGLMPPYEPEITRQYEFSDLTVFLYYDIFIE